MHSAAGITATQNTVRKSLAHNNISPMASKGPRKAPTVSSDCRSPKAAPRCSGGARSATSASRGAPRMALAHPVQQPGRDDPARRGGQSEQRLGQRAQPIAQQGQRLALAPPVAQRPRKHLENYGRALGRAFDQAHGEHAHPQGPDTSGQALGRGGSGGHGGGYRRWGGAVAAGGLSQTKIGAIVAQPPAQGAGCAPRREPLCRRTCRSHPRPGAFFPFSCDAAAEPYLACR